MAKCEVIDLTLSDSDSDDDFIQSKKAIHLFLYKVSVYYIKFLYIHRRMYYSYYLEDGLGTRLALATSISSSARTMSVLVLTRTCQGAHTTSDSDFISVVF